MGSGVQTGGQCTLIFTKGNSIIANNTSLNYGGGIYLDDNSALTTNNEGHVTFVNNTAKVYGGAIYSHNDDMTNFNTLVLYVSINNKCTILYNLSATFINNSAIRAGDILYGGTFVPCQQSQEGQLQVIQYTLQCPTVPVAITNSTSIHPLSTVSSDPLAVCPCVNGAINCTTRSLDRVVYPGQTLHVSLVTVGICEGVSPGTITVKHDNNIILISSADHTSASCTIFNYTVKLTTYISNTTLLLVIVSITAI